MVWKLKKISPEDLEVIVGSEIGTERGEVIGLFLSEEIVSHRLVEVVDEIREQDGLVVLPHPLTSCGEVESNQPRRMLNWPTVLKFLTLVVCVIHTMKKPGFMPKSILCMVLREAMLILLVKLATPV
nr:hypothetical protein [Methanobacterium formicicum]